MRIHSKMWATVSVTVLVGLGAGLAGFRFGAAASSTPAAVAKARISHRNAAGGARPSELRVVAYASGLGTSMLARSRAPWTTRAIPTPWAAGR